MESLITRADIQAFYQLSDSVNDKKLDQTIKESMISDLKPLLGREFFYEVVNNVGDHTDVLDAKNGESNGTSYDHVGLKEVLAHFVYGRLLMFGDIIENPFGFTRKLAQNNVSEKIDYPTRKAVNTEKRSLAFNLWLEIRFYMVLVSKDGFTCSQSQATKGKFKITKIN